MRDLWQEPRYRFVVTMAVFGLALWVVFREAVMGPVLTPMRALTAEGTLRLIQLTGLDGFRQANYIFHSSGFGIEITRGCTGFAGAAVLAAGIVAYPGAAARARGLGVCLAVPAFVVLNLIRMTHLYHLGAAQSPLFDLAHEVVWQLGMMLGVFVFWYAWVVWQDTVQPGIALHLRPASGDAQRQRSISPYCIELDSHRGVGS